MPVSGGLLLMPAAVERDSNATAAMIEWSYRSAANISWIFRSAYQVNY
jgi:hypothetical protein